MSSLPSISPITSYHQSLLITTRETTIATATSTTAQLRCKYCEGIFAKGSMTNHEKNRVCLWRDDARSNREASSRGQLPMPERLDNYRRLEGKEYEPHDGGKMREHLQREFFSPSSKNVKNTNETEERQESDSPTSYSSPTRLLAFNTDHTNRSFKPDQLGSIVVGLLEGVRPTFGVVTEWQIAQKQEASMITALRDSDYQYQRFRNTNRYDEFAVIYDARREQPKGKPHWYDPYPQEVTRFPFLCLDFHPSESEEQRLRRDTNANEEDRREACLIPVHLPKHKTTSNNNKNQKNREADQQRKALWQALHKTMEEKLEDLREGIDTLVVAGDFNEPASSLVERMSGDDSGGSSMPLHHVVFREADGKTSASGTIDNVVLGGPPPLWKWSPSTSSPSSQARREKRKKILNEVSCFSHIPICTEW